MNDQLRWRYWPIRLKLLFLTMLVSTLGIALVCVSLIVLENRTYRNQMESELHVIASILAEQSAAALLFEDREQLRSISSSLRQIETITQACVFDAAGMLLTSLNEPDKVTCPDLSTAPVMGFEANAYKLMVPVTLDQEVLGYIYLNSHLKVLRAHIQSFVMAAVGIGLLIQLLLLFVAYKLQRIVSHPILALSDTAEQIAIEHDYSIRAPVSGHDELGRLSATFNDMISTIQLQNRRILESRDSLERKVEERTAQLSLANRELEAFSYSVSHDLRQPLRAIEGFSQALEEDCEENLNDLGKDYLRRVRAASVRMSNLIDGLLVLSRVSRQTVEAEPVDLTSLLQEICDELCSIGDRPPTEIHIQPDMAVTGDSRMLRVAFQNLLENAWKYSSKKDRRRIEVTSTSDSAGAVVKVQDNGAGFDMKYVEKLFVAFNRLHTPSEFGGTGIGLATVYRVIRRHHGEVWAESELGKGATFYVKLPHSAEQR
ncbi:ATP-binding protein [Marinobacter sp. SS21]|uniref:ATP-binding protein n=1 Tax=Marinobacter sp. SS21 TaxID=2979460 RepID=UPI00232BEAE4|nr:ATP-binding protein [Marinobacter sp. SS21]MDC0664287.1 ATP-binding protein [Marinobacter sp. SS21]